MLKRQWSGFSYLTLSVACNRRDFFRHSWHEHEWKKSWFKWGWSKMLRSGSIWSRIDAFWSARWWFQVKGSLYVTAWICDGALACLCVCWLMSGSVLVAPSTINNISADLISRLRFLNLALPQTHFNYHFPLFLFTPTGPLINHYTEGEPFSFITADISN